MYRPPQEVRVCHANSSVQKPDSETRAAGLRRVSCSAKPVIQGEEANKQKRETRVDTARQTLTSRGELC